MKNYKEHTLSQYIEALSLKTPAPGGGSATALTGALGASLISMVANYSKGKSNSKLVERKIESIIKESNKIKNLLLEAVDLDAQAYRKVIESKKSSQERAKAQREARRIPRAVCKFCYQAISLTSYLVEKGNINLISDVEVAAEILFAAYNSALILSKI